MLQNGETTCTTCSTVPGIMYYLAMQRSGVCVHTTVYRYYRYSTTLQGYYTHNKIKNW